MVAHWSPRVRVVSYYICCTRHFFLSGRFSQNVKIFILGSLFYQSICASPTCIIYSSFHSRKRDYDASFRYGGGGRRGRRGGGKRLFVNKLRRIVITIIIISIPNSGGNAHSIFIALVLSRLPYATTAPLAHAHTSYYTIIIAAIQIKAHIHHFRRIKKNHMTKSFRLL